jgi:hypothetical protein
MSVITLSERLPNVDEFLALRKAVGWGSAARDAASRSLPNWLYGV